MFAPEFHSTKMTQTFSLISGVKVSIDSTLVVKDQPILENHFYSFCYNKENQIFQKVLSVLSYLQAQFHVSPKLSAQQSS